MRVAVAAGGTGGHVYPALAVLEELREAGAISAACWFGTAKGIEARILKDYQWVEFLPLPVRGLDRGRPWTWPLSLSGTKAAFFRCLSSLRQFRPDVVLGMGGYPAIAPILAAKLLGIPVAIHEQNASLGLANRLLAPIADLILLSFPTAHDENPRVIVTGNPVRRSILTQRRSGLGDELLVLGGSRGSRRLIEATIRAAPTLARIPTLKLRLLVGERASPSEVERRLREGGLSRVEVANYTDQMDEVLAQTRLVIARAGATTIAELAAIGCPAILVPWDGAAHGHQRANAQVCAAFGCLIIWDQDLDRINLGELVGKLWEDEGRLFALSNSIRKLSRPNAAYEIASALIALAGRKK